MTTPMNPTAVAEVNEQTATDLGTGVTEIQRNAKRLGLTWTLRPGTMDTTTTVKLDGDSSGAIPALSISGTRVIGERVMVMSVPPAGNYIIGNFDPTPGTVIARGTRDSNSSFTSGTTELPVMRIDDIPVRARRLYSIRAENLTLDGSVANDMVRCILRVSGSGIATVASTMLATDTFTVEDVTVATSGKVLGEYATSADQTLSVLLSIVRMTGTGVFRTLSGTGFDLTVVVQYLGADPGDTGVDL